eukprot:865014-Amphidinium_carterae.1
MLLLRRIRRNLLSIAVHGNSQWQENLSAYRFVHHSPTSGRDADGRLRDSERNAFGDNDEDYDSDGILKVDPSSCMVDDRAYSLDGTCCTCPSISSSVVDSIADCDTDYH